ncbi:hypothetical protein BC941DRAFT_473315 [Chlamydoabsidia padenii]|nr:hypothetical protein BC941DRAFT_473315 [Chlamydoabsidia padenii]
MHPITEANNNLHTSQLLTSQSQAPGYEDWLYTHRDINSTRYAWMNIKLAYFYNAIMNGGTQSRSHSTSNQVTTITLDDTR